jgi:hypothetical protein
MKTLNAQQLAFLLDIKKEDARIRMCNAWEKAHNIPRRGFAFEESLSGNVSRDAKNKIKDPYPNDMLIEMLAIGLNLPCLQQMVDDIEQNYLKRNATKKYILSDFPETELKKKAEKGSLLTLNIPPVLLSMLPQETINIIREEWTKRFPIAVVK